MRIPNLVDHLGRPITLGPELGKGGEASVFHVANFPDLAAKVYHQPRSPHEEAKLRATQEKLRAMVGIAPQALFDVVAWPTATLHEGLNGPIRGFVMRKLQGFKQIHFLYSPAHRKQAFPRADWAFLIHCAMNCAAAFDTVHAYGMVIGDVNELNVFVSDKGFVALIDCDSFLVRSNGQTYPCSEVGVGLFTPPELQGGSFRGVLRTPNHDRFGLAVLIFYLLFMNRHPFAGRYIGPGDMPIDRAIKEYRFAYSRSAATYHMQTPIHALPLSAVSPQLVGLFERAFCCGSEQPNARPSAAEWQSELKTFLGLLRACPLDPGHVYAPHLPQCPWHALMQQGAPNFFVTVAYFRAAAAPGGIAFDLSAMWTRIEQVKLPRTAYVRPAMLAAGSPNPWPSSLPRTLPPAPVPPAILTAPPTLPANLRAAPLLPPKPVLPAILTAPPAPPPNLRVAPPLPPKPILPAIITAPPAPPAMIAAPTRYRKQVVPTTFGHRIIGIAAAVCLSGFLPVGLLGAMLGGLVFGPQGAGFGLIGMVVFLAFVVFGLLWLVLDWQRRQHEHKLNREYEEEIAQQKAEARRHRKAWEAQLAAQQAEARGVYAAELTRWEERRAAAYAEVRRQQAEWEAQVAAHQAKARGLFAAEMARWEERVAAICAEAQRQQEEWEAQLAAQQVDARHRHETELQHWQNTVAAMRAEAERRRQAAPDAWQRAEAAEQNWAVAAARLAGEFDKKKAELNRLRDRHRELAGEYATERHRMQASAREIQLYLFLQQKILSDHKISGIGAARLATLASYGIETAFDIVEAEVLQVPGFKEQLTARLVQWRRSMESLFVFNAAAGIPSQVQQALDSKYAQARQQVEAALLSGERELQVIATGTENELRQLYEHIKLALRQYSQAHADVQVIPTGL
jgi:DNA-binding helix-hairpin-helix protein with protein kinase domain